jgi:hypothetical protein
VGFSRREKITGAMVLLSNEDKRSHLIVTTTDADGMFRVEGIPQGSYRILIYRDGVRPAVKEKIRVTGPFRAVAELTVERGDEPPPAVAIGLPGEAGPSTGEEEIGGPPPFFDASPSAGGLTIEVTGPEGEPVEGARVLLRRIGGGVDPLRGETGEDGLLAVDRPLVGPYSVRIVSPGHLPLRIARLEVGEGNPGGPLWITAFLVDRPYAYPGTPSDLLPDERPLPPPGLDLENLPFLERDQDADLAAK